LKTALLLSFERIEQIITRILYHTGWRKKPKMNAFVPILAYHEICDLPKEINRIHSYNVTPSAFKDQMGFLYKNNYSVMRLEEVISSLTQNRELPHKSVVITFDDGYRNNYTNAFPVLKRFNFPATIFLATDYIGTNKVFPWFRDLLGEDEEVKENWIPMSWREVREMSKDGITFGSHTCSHANIRQMSKSTFEEEIERSKDLIEGQIDKNINLFSYPFSFPKYRRRYRDLINKTRKALLGRGYWGACTTIIGTNSLKSDPFCLRRIQIKNTDNLFSFRAKVVGANNWVSVLQKTYQKIIEPLIERRRRTL
jgi:peptidoglycan/xylan/chitin deacetylase (PgdA/CDA1 family)